MSLCSKREYVVGLVSVTRIDDCQLMSQLTPTTALSSLFMTYVNVDVNWTTAIRCRTTQVV
jgi:hypothetical protein